MTHRLVGSTLPVTDGESPHKSYPANVVHIKGYAEDHWPPIRGDSQGINYRNWFARKRCKHDPVRIACFFWVRYDRGIESFEGHVCADCGTITWAYTDMGKD